MRDRKGVNVEGRGCGDDLRGEEGGEATIKILCIRKQYFRQKGKTNITVIFHNFCSPFCNHILLSTKKIFPMFFKMSLDFL